MLTRIISVAVVSLIIAGGYSWGHQAGYRKGHEVAEAANEKFRAEFWSEFRLAPGLSWCKIMDREVERLRNGAK